MRMRPMRTLLGVERAEKLRAVYNDPLLTTVLCLRHIRYPIPASGSDDVSHTPYDLSYVHSCTLPTSQETHCIPSCAHISPAYHYHASASATHIIRLAITLVLAPRTSNPTAYHTSHHRSPPRPQHYHTSDSTPPPVSPTLNYPSVPSLVSRLSSAHSMQHTP